MMDNPRASVNMIENFKGVFSDTEPGNVPDGYLLRQLNVMSVRNNELVTRGGIVDIELDELE